jgi:hypothetical protein
MAMGDSNLRVGDSDRDAVARTLRDHCAAGRLSIEEFDERVEAAYRATTRADLSAVTSDLPTADTAGLKLRRQRRRIFWPGVAPFHEERHLRAACRASFDAAVREIVPRMGMQGFHVVDEVSPRRLRFLSDSGLMLTVMFHPAVDDGTIVTAFGHAPRAVRKAFATLRD